MDYETSPRISVATAAQELRAGRMVLITDDEGRENEADLCLAAQFATPEAINFLVHHACGLVCVALAGERLDALDIPQEPHQGQPLQNTAFSISVDARHGTTTGISVYDRATTIRALVNPTSRPEDFARPGHVFPLRARPGGTLERRGHTEASVDLARIAGLEPGMVICEVLNEQGEPARGEELYQLARQWGIGITSVEAIATYRQTQTINLVAETRLPLPEATFTMQDYCELATGQHYLALLLGDLSGSESEPPLVRLHSACATGDIFGSQRCDCQAQLHASLRAIAAEGRGLLLYLPQEGRGIGLTAKLMAYELQDQGYDTVDANIQLGYPVDARSYDTALELLKTLGLSNIRLLTNNPQKLQALKDGGLTVERVSLETKPHPSNARYLETKSIRLGHMLTLQTSSIATMVASAEEKKTDDTPIHAHTPTSR